MKIEASNDVANTQPLNSEASFRAELSKLQQQAENNLEASHESQESNAEVTEESAVEVDSAGDIGDDAGHDDIGDNSDGNIDSRAPIPYSRLKKETAKNKALREELERAQAERIRAQTELDLINRALTQFQQPQMPQEPPRQDGFEPLDTEAHQYYNQHYASKNELAQMQAILQQQQAEIHNTRLGNMWDQQQTQFEQKNPDFREAYQHLYKAEIENVKMLGADNQQAVQAATVRLQNMARMASQQGKNVAEVFYNISKSYGYTPKAKRPAASNLDAIETNMRKSKVADVPVAAVAPGNVGNFTTLKNFEKHVYDGNPFKREENAKAFHDVLRKVREGK